MKRFQKKVEDFTCEKCGLRIVGKGYTNHCPKCLWSKHVDINPGDRAANCGGLMEPIEIESSRDGYVIISRCVKCGHTHRNRSAPEDSFSQILAIVRKRSEFGTR